ncbi:hypothetical protein KP509_18G085900 [Ceratopteris richardii]|uniref:Uncharacterized protein n=1 Tax=Ceratopteris richardii TaxID=49495 RepID=A0A8T2SUX8_CERRI|nr:hypothetical protein KP509_18G085900 [Ceratopteris richardii]
MCDIVNSWRSRFVQNTDIQFCFGYIVFLLPLQFHSPIIGGGALTSLHKGFLEVWHGSI